MPLYDFTCVCGYENEHIANVNETLPCPACGLTMNRGLSAGRMIGVRSVGYYDDTLGAFIDSNSQRRRLMKEQGVSEYNKINHRVTDRGKWV